MSNDKQVKIIFGLVVFTVGLVTVVAFAISYRSLMNVAFENGKDYWFESFAWPLIIDGPILAFSLAALLAAYLGRAQWPARLLVGLSTLATIFFNYVHAPQDSLARIVAITAPVMYFLSFETLLWLIKAMVERINIIASIDQLTDQAARARVELEQMTQQHDTLTAQIEQARAKLADIMAQQREAKRVSNRASVEEMNQAKQEQIDQRREQVLVMYGQGMTQTDIANELDVSVTTIKRDLKALNGRANGSNGHGGDV